MREILRTIEPFKIKKGMFLTNAKGQNFYAISENEVRELKDGGSARWTTEISMDGMKEMVTYAGAKFSDKLVVK